MRLFLLILFAFLLPLTTVKAGPRKIEGQVFAEVVTVRDGDTIKVVAHTWPGHLVEVYIRIRGIDTPELSGRCPSEITRAVEAKRELDRIVDGQPVMLTQISGGKYFGRVIARVQTSAGLDVSEHMLASGHAVPYRGRKRQSWCEPPVIADNSG